MAAFNGDVFRIGAAALQAFGQSISHDLEVQGLSRAWLAHASGAPILAF
jgi:hypothetical protein